MLKKIIIGAIILVAIAVAVIVLVPWGEYESTLEKSEITQEESIDSSGTIVPSLSLIQGNYSVVSGENAQAELLFDVEGLKKTKGAFEKFSINFDITDDFTRSTLVVEIESASINTGNTMRDEHLAEEDFFNVANYPSINFSSAVIVQTDTGYVAQGDLTLLESSQAIGVPFKHLGNGTNKENESFEAFEGSFVFDRTEYGMEEVSGAGNVVTVSFYCELLLKETE